MPAINCWAAISAPAFKSVRRAGNSVSRGSAVSVDLSRCRPERERRLPLISGSPGLLAPLLSIQLYKLLLIRSHLEEIFIRGARAAILHPASSSQYSQKPSYSLTLNLYRFGLRATCSAHHLTLSKDSYCVAERHHGELRSAIFLYLFTQLIQSPFGKRSNTTTRI